MALKILKRRWHMHSLLDYIASTINNPTEAERMILSIGLTIYKWKCYIVIQEFQNGCYLHTTDSVIRSSYKSSKFLSITQLIVWQIECSCHFTCNDSWHTTFIWSREWKCLVYMKGLNLLKVDFIIVNNGLLQSLYNVSNIVLSF